MTGRLEILPAGARAPRPRPYDARLIALGGPVAVAAALGAVGLGPQAIGVAAALGLVWVLVSRPLVLYLLFVYVPIFAGESFLASLPISVALAGLLAAVCLQRLLTGQVRRLPWRMVIPVAVIAILLPVSLAWTPEPTYGALKVQKFLILSVLAVVAPFFLIRGERDLRRLLYALAGGAALVAAVALVHTPTPEAGVVSQGDVQGRLEFGGQIFTSRFVAAGALVFFFLPTIVASRRLALAGPLVGVALVGVCFGLGSRGPLLSLGLALTVTLVAVMAGSAKRLLPVMLAICLAVALFPLVKLPEASQQRVTRAVEHPVDTLRTDGRAPLYSQALRLIEENPVRGVGAGGFALYTSLLSRQQERYPHNIFLELGAEIGLLPAVLLALSIAALLWSLYRLAWLQRRVMDRQLVLVVAGVFLLNLFATQFSGDINDNLTFWAFFGIAWLVALHGLGPAEEHAA